MEKQVTILNKNGLHARPASEFVKLASRFQSEINLLAGTKVANGKSIINVLSLAAAEGTVLTLKAVGPDETEALESLSTLIERRFGEE